MYYPTYHPVAILPHRTTAVINNIAWFILNLNRMDIYDV
jgi:hypothetical protein